MEQHSNVVEKIGTGLVCSLETFKNAKIELVKRLSGFNGLAVYKYGQVRKIEIKTFQKGDKWIAINGMRAIDKLFFEPDYWIYFVLVPENIIVCAKGLPFIQKQMKLSKNNTYLKELKQWMLQTKQLAKDTGLQLTLKVNVPFSTPLRRTVTEIVENNSNEWENEIIEIWENKRDWTQIYQSEKYVEI